MTRRLFAVAIVLSVALHYLFMRHMGVKVTSPAKKPVAVVVKCSAAPRARRASLSDAAKGKPVGGPALFKGTVETDKPENPESVNSSPKPADGAIRQSRLKRARNGALPEAPRRTRSQRDMGEMRKNSELGRHMAALAGQLKVPSGNAVPALSVEWPKSGEAVSRILAFYDFPVILFPPKFEYIVLYHGERAEKIDDNGGLSVLTERFSNRYVRIPVQGIKDTSPLALLKAKLCEKFSLDAGRHEIAALCSKASGAYLYFQQKRACEVAKLKVTEVASCHGAFRETNEGTYALVITSVTTKTGVTYPVTADAIHRPRS